MTSNPPITQAAIVASSDDAKLFRRLSAKELVSHGDFVADDRGGFELWDGPNGFRADAFIKPIYRKQKAQPTPLKKTPRTI